MGFITVVDFNVLLTFQGKQAPGRERKYVF